MAGWPCRLLALGVLLGPWALGEPLLLAREVRLLWAGEWLRAGLEALAEAPTEGTLAHLFQAHALWAGSLGAHPELLSQVAALLAEAKRLSEEEPEGLRALAQRASPLLSRAQAQLVPNPTPGLKAGLLVQMALGVAEGYRQGFLLNKEAYRLGFFLLWHLQIHLEELRPHLPSPVQERVAENLAALRALYPASAPPSIFRHPDEAKEAAMDLLFALEAGLGLDLWPRDPLATLERLQSLVQEACQSPDPGLAQEAWEGVKSLAFYLIPSLAFGQGEALARALETRPPACQPTLVLLQEAAAGPWE
ncbi:hypothetical protein [Thermus igniterrae]|jgi:hypothetical protein|uniref:hypothetical protein n=1 Tax=Thermus igniterrae TaxID=88189 RepID=UPI000377A850|nr:hypothetical protein [Thermus igniterrae]